MTNMQVGREYNHLEDLVFISGSSGIARISEILKRIQNGTESVSFKWDGNPTVYWGRDPDGKFVLSGKNGWGRHKPESAQCLKNFVMRTGNAEPWREVFADTLGEVYQILEDHTPSDFRGYVYGDLLWHSRNPVSIHNNRVHFSPNKVTYTVNDPDLKDQVKQSVLGIAAHKIYQNYGDSQGMIYDNRLETSGPVKIFGQQHVDYDVDFCMKLSEQLDDIRKEHAKCIDAFLEKRKGLADLKNIIYMYVNQTVKAGRLNQLTHGFPEWLETSKVSKNKQKLIQDLDKEHKAMAPMLQAVDITMKIKDSIIDQLDNHSHCVTSVTDGCPGGEGYVATQSYVKLVPRHRWIPN